MDWLDKLRSIKRESNLTTKDIAYQSGIPEPTLEKLFAGKTKDPKLNTIMTVVHCLGHSLDDLAPNPSAKSLSTAVSQREQEHIKKYRALNEHGKRMVDSVLDFAYNYQMEADQKVTNVLTLYPIKNFLIRVSAGTGNFLDSDEYDILQLTESPPRGADFLVDIIGDSMEPTFEDGDKVYVHRQEELEPGEIGIFYYDGDAYIKEYQPGRLVSHNKAYDDVILSEYYNVRCYGKVIGVVNPDSIYK